MNMRDLIPWGRTAPNLPAMRNKDEHPFFALQRDVNRLFDDVFTGFPSSMSGIAANWPRMEVSDLDKEIRISAEMSGLDEKDVEIFLEDGMLTVRGEKKSETEDKERHFSERVYGRFERRITVGNDIEQDQVKAAFKNGVLTLTLPKTEPAQNKVKRIVIEGNGR